MRGFQPAKNKAKPFAKPFANGGPVRGPGTGTSDEVLDKVPSGTYIMPADSTKAIGQAKLGRMGADNPAEEQTEGAAGDNPSEEAAERGQVPVALSNGEFKIPPEQVHAVGVQALDQMRAATHTPGPARGFAPGAQQQPEPPLFFANGGVVDEEQRKATSPTNIYPQSSPAAGTNVYGGVGFSPDQFGSSGQFAKVPATIGQQPGRQPAPVPAPAATPQGMTDAQRAAAISQIPTGGVTTPPVTAAPAPAPAAAQSPAPAKPVASPVLDAQAQSDRAKLGAAWDTVKDVNDDAGRAIADVATMIPRGLAGAYDSAVVRPMRALGVNANYLSPSLVPDGVDPSSLTPFTDQKRMQAGQPTPAAAAPEAPAASTAVARSGVAPTAPVAAGSPAGAGRGSVNPPLANPAVPAPTSTAPAATEIAPGVFRSGNSYADSAAGAVGGLQTRGLPSVRNAAAVDALAARSQQESLVRGFQPAQGAAVPAFEAPVVRHSGNDWQARQDLKNLETSASSIMNRPEWNSAGMGRFRGAPAGTPPAVAAYQAALQTDAALKQAQPGMDQAAMRENATLAREGMNQEGADRRNAADNSTRMAEVTARGFTDRGRLALDQSKAALDSQVRGFDIRAGQRQEALSKKYEAAKTPEEKAAIAQQIRDLSGKQAESPWKVQVTPAMKNADGSTSEGSIYRYNSQTGQVERVDGGGEVTSKGPAVPKSKAEYDALPKGAQYIKDGKILVKS